MALTRKQNALRGLANARRSGKRLINNVRAQRFLRRLRNEDGGEGLDEFISDEDTGADEADVDDGGAEEVGVGDLVEVEIPDGVTLTAKIVDTEPEEVVEETEVVEEGGDDDEDGEETVENRRLRNARRRLLNARRLAEIKRLHNARRIRNARRLAAAKRAKTNNSRRTYRVRTVTRNIGADPESWYAKTIPTDGIEKWSTTMNKARKYDKLVAMANGSIDQEVDDLAKKIAEKVAPTENRRGVSSRRVRNARLRRALRNYRRFMNEDEEMNIDDIAPEMDAPVAAPETNDAPYFDEERNGVFIPLTDTEAEDLKDQIEEAVDGEDGEETVENRRLRNARRRLLNARRIRNARRMRAARLHNARVRNARVRKVHVRNEANPAASNVSIQNSSDPALTCGLGLISTYSETTEKN